MPLLTDGQSNHIYRYGTLKGIPKRRPTIFLIGWKSLNNYTKEENLIKPPYGQMPTMPVMAGKKRLNKPPQEGLLWKLQEEHADHPNDRTTGDKKLLLHGPVHSSEECKATKD